LSTQPYPILAIRHDLDTTLQSAQQRASVDIGRSVPVVVLLVFIAFLKVRIHFAALLGLALAFW